MGKIVLEKRLILERLVGDFKCLKGSLVIFLPQIEEKRKSKAMESKNKQTDLLIPYPSDDGMAYGNLFD